MLCTQKEEIFEKVNVYGRVIEFQRKGCLRTYCVYFSDKDFKDKLYDSESSNTKISADKYPESDWKHCGVGLRDSIHSPYGDLIPSAVCMVKCDKEIIPDFCWLHFPKRSEKKTKPSETAYKIIFMKREMLNEGVYSIQKCPYKQNWTERIKDNGSVVP